MLEISKGEQGTWVDADLESLVGDVKEWAKANNVQSARIPAYWLYQDGKTFALGEPPRSPDEWTMLFFHGGGYMILSAHPSDPTADIPRQAMRACAPLTRSLSLEYRLSSTPGGAFPAALLERVWRVCAWRACADGGANRLHDVLAATPSAEGTRDSRSL